MKFTITILLFAFLSNAFAQIPPQDLTLWLRADTAVVIDGNNKVSQWNDQSGNDNHAFQSNPAFQPIIVNNILNGLPIIRFSSIASTDFDRLDIPIVNQSATQKVDVFIVYKITADSNNTGSIIIESSNDFNFNQTGWNIADNDDSCLPCENSLTAGHKGNEGFNLSIVNQPLGMYKLVNTTFDKTLQTEEAKIRLNKTLLARVDNTYDNNNTNSFGNNPVFIGQRGNGSVTGGIGLDGDIAEIIIYNNVLDSISRDAVETYLCNKWLLTTSVDETDIKLHISFSPNPVQSILIANCDCEYDIRIFDTKGRLLKEWKKLINSQILDISELSEGIYYVNAAKGNKSLTSKIIKIK